MVPAALAVDAALAAVAVPPVAVGLPRQAVAAARRVLQMVQEQHAEEAGDQGQPRQALGRPVLVVLVVLVTIVVVVVAAAGVGLSLCSNTLVLRTSNHVHGKGLAAGATTHLGKSMESFWDDDSERRAYQEATAQRCHQRHSRLLNLEPVRQGSCHKGATKHGANCDEQEAQLAPISVAHCVTMYV